MTEPGKKRIERAVFCDFDGTITAEETFVGMARRFVPGVFEEVSSRLRSGSIALKDGVRAVVQAIPSARYGEMLDYIRSKPVRAGLAEFLDFLGPRGVPFIVVSSGLRPMVEARLEGLRGRVHAVHAPDLDTGGEFLRLVSAYEGEDELVHKASVVASYGVGEPVAIGDGITDLSLALAASVTFARGHLAKRLSGMGRPFVPWEDFFDVRDHLEGLWGKGGL